MTNRGAKPLIAVFSGATSTLQNTPSLITSNKARLKYGLPHLTNKDGGPPRFDSLRPQRLAAPVTVYVEQFSAHPLEEDAAELYGPPDGYLDAAGVFHREQTSPQDTPVYEVVLLPEDGLYPLPYMARQADGQPWDALGVSADAPPELTRQSFYPDASRIIEEIDRFGLSGKGLNNALSSRADFHCFRAAPPAGYKRGLAAERRTDVGEGDIPAEVLGVDFFPYGAFRVDPPKATVARVVNAVQRVLDTGRYTGAIWLEGSPNLEETLYILNLFLDTALPICGNSSQRPHLSLANDGDRNIVEATDYVLSTVWADEQGRDTVGVVAVLDQQAFTAREIQKGDARPGGYVATGGHGGVVASLGSSAEDVALTFRPVKLHTYKSAVNLRRLPASVMGVREEQGRPVLSAVQTKDHQGWLLEGAVPEVRIVKHARYLAQDSASDPESEVEVLARIERNLQNAPLAGFVGEGRMGGGMSHSLDAALELAAYHGMPVVKVGRGNAEGFVPHDLGGPFIAGSNLTANKARWLLMACLLKYGSLPPAADPRHPTADEVEATRQLIAEYQAVFDTH